MVEEQSVDARSASILRRRLPLRSSPRTLRPIEIGLDAER